MVVVWSKAARLELRKAFDHITLFSVKYPVVFRDVVIDLTIGLGEHPEKYSVDKFKLNNDGSWRAFEMYNYRISYKITPNQIRIVRLRHTSRSPVKY